MQIIFIIARYIYFFNINDNIFNVLVVKNCYLKVFSISVILHIKENIYSDIDMLPDFSFLK